MASASCNFPVMKEGVLLKRQRGLTHIDLRRLKFQHRFCRLTQQCLFYFEKKKVKSNLVPVLRSGSVVYLFLGGGDRL